mmetsp:Transcript_24209/g.66289  ORF Transcript_24209/g.66289 Transcript_24209/m.66289 type:complete len:101 (+) Transcript_24209:237-539(+)
MLHTHGYIYSIYIHHHIYMRHLMSTHHKRMRRAPLFFFPFLSPLAPALPGAASKATSSGVANPAYSANTGSNDRCISAALPFQRLENGMPMDLARARNVS